MSKLVFREGYEPTKLEQEWLDHFNRVMSPAFDVAERVALDALIFGLGACSIDDGGMIRHIPVEDITFLPS